MSIDYCLLGRRIRDRRKGLGLKQKELAQLTGISNNHLSAIEHGRQKPSLDLLFLISNQLNCTPDFFLFGFMEQPSVSHEDICEACYPQILTFSTTDGLIQCLEQDIICIESLYRKTLVHTRFASYEAKQNMKHWLTLLPSDRFYQSHREYLINLDYVKNYTHDSITLRGVPSCAFLSEDRYPCFVKLYQQYLERRHEKSLTQQM